MDIKTLEQANRIIASIEQLRRIKEKLTWFITNDRLNKNTLIGFGTTNSSSFDKDSIIDKSVYPLSEIIEEYFKRLEKRITDLQNTLEIL